MLRVKRLTGSAIIPTRSNKTDAGIDLYADEDVEIQFGQVVKIKTGIAIELPEGTYGDMRSRSSFWSRGLLVTGTIDSDYRGEVVVVMGWNCLLEDSIRYIGFGSSVIDPVQIKRGDKIAQMVITAIYTSPIEEAEELTETDRGNKGFGSTGSR